MKHIKEHWILYLFAIITITFSSIFPDLEITITGGLAWFFSIMLLFIGLIMVITGIKGGEVTYSSKGAIPLIKKLLKKNRT